MSTIKYVGIDELLDNPTPRVPVCLCLDTSGSMGTVESGSYEDTGRTVFEDGKEWRVVTGGSSRIDELQKGVELFLAAIREDEVAMYAAEIAIVTFNDRAECLRNFAGVDTQPEVPAMEPKGNTALGEGVSLALDLLESRKQQYKDTGVDYYQPWLVIMSDGYPNGDSRVLEDAIAKTADLANNKKLAVFSIGIGAEADMKTLTRFSPKRPALRLQGLKFREFFEWLSQSVSRTSQSMPGDNIKLDLEGIKGWGEL